MMTDDTEAAGPQTDAERAAAAREHLKSVHAFDLAYGMMVDLVAFGYQKMGLTDETADLRDLGDARLAIELLRATLEVLERELGPARSGDLKSTLAQMQLNYARAVRVAPAPKAAPVEQPTPPETTSPATATQEPAAKKAPAKKRAAKNAPAKRPGSRSGRKKEPAPAEKRPGRRGAGDSPAD